MKTEKKTNELLGRKNKICWEIDWDHFYILNIEFGEKKNALFYHLNV